MSDTTEQLLALVADYKRRYDELLNGIDGCPPPVETRKQRLQRLIEEFDREVRMLLRPPCGGCGGCLDCLRLERNEDHGD